MAREKSRRAGPPPEALESEWLIQFLPAAPRRQEPVDDGEPTFGPSVPGWLRDAAERWRAVPGCSNLWGTSSTPVESLGPEARSDARCARSRTLVSLDWHNGPGLSSSWSVEALGFGRRSRLYVEWKELHGLCLLAYSDEADGGRADRQFLRALFRDNGGEFDTTVMYGLPSSVTRRRSVTRGLMTELLMSAIGQGEWWGEVPDDIEAAARALVNDTWDGGEES